ncbi:hypothetical protein GGI20_003273 [Coemansia sp. BCRC 34301]|nr:hypothetical protein GGI20_003273 [Coemansia sp. BCRC 34301]
MDISTFAPRIRDILQSSDLSTVSAKKVRRQLETEMRVSLDPYKGDIDDIIKQQFQQIHTETQQRQQQQQQYAQQYAQQQGQMGGVYGVSQAMSGGLHMPPPSGGAIAVGGVLGSSAVSGGGLSPGDAPRKRGRPRKPENERKQQRKKRVVDPSKPKRSTGLSKPMKLSADLASFLGQKYAARTEVVKSLWKYIKEHGLQDTADKRYILCDDKLLVLFHEARLYMYTMNKLLNDHFIKPTPEENAEAIALLGLAPDHPAAADSASLLPSSVVKGESGMDAHSPLPSEGSDGQQTDEEEDEDEDEDDAKSEPQQIADDVKPGLPVGSAAPLTLPPMPASVNGASSSGTGGI